MSRILLLLPILLWLTWVHSPAVPAPLVPDLMTGAAVFLALFAGLVLGLGLWSRMLARRIAGSNLQRSLKYFNKVMFAARIAIPVWFAAGLFVLGWGFVVERMLGPMMRWQVELPSMLIASAPALLAWMGLWWSQYPADRALREQSMLIQFEENLPVHASPSFRSYFASNLRLQILFILVPVLLIFLARDLVMLGITLSGVRLRSTDLIEASVSLCSVASMFVFAPELLRRLLHTQRLPDSPLRRRLEAMCARSGLRYRDILLWRTQNNMANAAVMGIVPRWRYILLSDLLIETMTDQQIEAVFAHEVGHVVHRHMAWYVVFFLILTCTAAGPGDLLQAHFRSLVLPSWMPLDLVMMVLGLGLFLLIFGYLSRRFEQQADVFAARTIQASDSPLSIDTHVGQHGAQVFASALNRVAAINNIPVEARSWCHGSIAKRIGNLKALSHDPSLTGRFDRFMGRIYVTMLVALCATVTWAAAVAL